MTRALFVCLFVVCLAPSLAAQRAFKCLLVNEKDPKACAPPPCEFMAELKLAKAADRASYRFNVKSTPTLRTNFQLWDAIDKEQRPVFAKYSKCRFHPRANLRAANSDRSCEVEVVSTSNRSDGTCSEFVEAEQAVGAIHQNFCTPGKTMTFGRILIMSRAQAIERIDSLEASLYSYLASCAPDAKLSRELSKAGFKALVRDAKDARERWLAQRNASAPSLTPGR